MPPSFCASILRFATANGHAPLGDSIIQNERISTRLCSIQHNKPVSIFDMPLIQTDLGTLKRKKTCTTEYQDFIDRPRSKPKVNPPTPEYHPTQMLMCHETLDDPIYEPPAPFSRLRRGDNVLSLTIRSGVSFGVVRFSASRPSVRAFGGHSASKKPAPSATPGAPEITDVPCTPSARKNSEAPVCRRSSSPPLTESRKRRVAYANSQTARVQNNNPCSFDNRLAVAAALSSNSEDAKRFEFCDLPCDVVDNAALRRSPNPLEEVMSSPSIHRSSNDCDSHLQEVELTLQMLGDEFDQFLQKS